MKESAGFMCSLNAAEKFLYLFPDQCIDTVLRILQVNYADIC